MIGHPIRGRRSGPVAFQLQSELRYYLSTLNQRKKMKLSEVFTATVLVLAPALALAEPNIVCESSKKTTLIVLTDIQEADGTNGDFNVKAKLIVAKSNGNLDGGEVTVSGTKSLSAKGYYYELTGGDGYSLLVSAPASYSPSELKVRKNTIDLNCNSN
jgi:hypothetical protein